MNITFTPEELEAIGRNDLSGFDHELSRYELIAAFRQLAGMKRQAEELADTRLDEIIRLEKKLEEKTKVKAEAEIRELKRATDRLTKYNQDLMAIRQQLKAELEEKDHLIEVLKADIKALHEEIDRLN